MNSSFIAFHAGMACGFIVDALQLGNYVAWDPFLGISLTALAACGVLFGTYKLLTERREIPQ